MARFANSEEEEELWKRLDPLKDRERWNLVGFFLPSFRQLKNIVLPLDGLTVIVGPNGSGKTSLLEAIRTTGSAAGATFAKRDNARHIGYLDMEEALEEAQRLDLLQSDLLTLRSATSGSDDTPADAAFVYQVDPPKGFNPEEIASETFRDIKDGDLQRRAVAALAEVLGNPHVATFPNRGEVFEHKSLVLVTPPGSLETATDASSGNAIVENLFRAHQSEVRSGWSHIAATSVRRPYLLRGPSVQVLSMREDTLQEEVSTAVRNLREERVLAAEPEDLDAGIARDPNVAVWTGFVQLPNDPHILSRADRNTLISQSLSSRWFVDATHIVLGVSQSESIQWFFDYFFASGFNDPVFDPENIVETAPIDDPQQVGRLLAIAKAELRRTGLIDVLRYLDSASDDDVLWDDVDQDLATAWKNHSSFLSQALLTKWGLGDTSSIWDPKLEPPEFTIVADGGLAIDPAARGVLAELERESNQVAPEFVTRSGRIRLTIDIAAEHPIGVKFLDATGSRHIHELGRGVQRWIAASVRLAARRISGEIGGGILLIDEPELALHPDAQDQIADWCVVAAPFYKAIVIASHSPSFLSLPASGASTYILRSSRDGHSVLNPLEVESLVGLASVGGAAGLGRMTLLSVVRGFVVVEGPADVQVLNAFMGPELRQHRVVPVPLHGHGKLKALVQPHLLEALGRPVAVMLDDVARDVIDGKREARSDEEMSIDRVLTARADGLRISAVSFEAPDIIAGLPEAAVKRVRPRFNSWIELLGSWDRDGEDNFKRHVLRSVQWKLHDDRGFISAVVEAIEADDDWPPWIMRTRSELLAWSDQSHGR